VKAHLSFSFAFGSAALVNSKKLSRGIRHRPDAKSRRTDEEIIDGLAMRAGPAPAPGHKLCIEPVVVSARRIFAFPHDHGGIGDPDRAQWLHVRRAFGEHEPDLALIEVGPHQVERYAAGDFIAHGVRLGGCGGGIQRLGDGIGSAW
jgi:hypothetical protein